MPKPATQNSAPSLTLQQRRAFMQLPLEDRRRQMAQQAERMSDDPFWQRLESTWAAQQVRGHEPRRVEQVEAERWALRDEMEQEIQQAMRLQQACRQARTQLTRGKKLTGKGYKGTTP